MEEEIQGDLVDFLMDVNVLIINVPPGLRNPANGSYFKRMELLLKAVRASTVKKVLFVSSTSVYGNVTGIITEETEPQPQTLSAKHILAAEQLLRGTTTLETTVLRFGGLIGPQRHPVNTLSGKTGLENGNDTINLIHLDDCIAMIINILKKGYWNRTLNGVYPHHPTKKEYYTKKALELGIPPPSYVSTRAKKQPKIVKTADFYVKRHPFLTSI